MKMVVPAAVVVVERLLVAQEPRLESWSREEDPTWLSAGCWSWLYFDRAVLAGWRVVLWTGLGVAFRALYLGLAGYLRVPGCFLEAQAVCRREAMSSGARW